MTWHGSVGRLHQHSHDARHHSQAHTLVACMSSDDMTTPSMVLNWIYAHHDIKLEPMSGTMLNCINGAWDQHGRWASMPRHYTGPDHIKKYVVQLLPST
jgi:hypothetical protein